MSKTMDIPDYIKHQLNINPEFQFILVTTYPGDERSVLCVHKERESAERMGAKSIANFPPGSTWKVIHRSQLK